MTRTVRAVITVMAAVVLLASMLGISGCGIITGSRVHRMPRFKVNNVLDEMIAHCDYGFAVGPTRKKVMDMPRGFSPDGPSGTDPELGSWVGYEYRGEDLGAVWDPSAVDLEDRYYKTPRVASQIQVSAPFITLTATTPKIFGADGKVYMANIGVFYEPGKSPTLREGYSRFDDPSDNPAVDRDEISREEFLSATGIDGDELDAWAEHCIRDVYVKGYVDTNAAAGWSRYSMDDLGEGIDLSDGFIGKMRAGW